MTRQVFRAGLALAFTVVVAACGGGGNGGFFFPPAAGSSTPPATTTMPPAGQADPLSKFLAYLKALVATALDTAEPADVSAFDPPPTSNTTEPVATQ
jgi:predicted small lipoprotein YifL